MEPQVFIEFDYTSGWLFESLEILKTKWSPFSCVGTVYVRLPDRGNGPVLHSIARLSALFEPLLVGLEESTWILLHGRQE